MPARSKPLAPGAALARTVGGLQHGVGPPRNTQLVAKRKNTTHWQRCRAIVWDRAQGRCEYCGHALKRDAWECHHRQFRSQGGPDSPENLVALDFWCHRLAHEERTVFEPLGFVVASTADPAWTLVTVHGRGPVYLDGGTYRRAA